MRHTFGDNYVVYYYTTNLQGDVIRMVDVYGNTAAYYEYDPYGNAIQASGSHATINPLRYRGYYYDHETGMYYCQSRYYDPAIGRFINADEYTSTGQGIIGNNMFAYCGNNPIAHEDADGEAFETAFDAISLGASIAEVVLTPTDPWAWAGLVGDVIDVAVPFVGGIGEAVRLAGVVEDTTDVVSSAKKVKHLVSDSVGAYEIKYKSGLNYVGKGPFSRAITSATEHTKKDLLNNYKGDEVVSITWKRANSAREAFVEEYKMQTVRGVNNARTYNRIWSPGKRITCERRLCK